MKKRERHPLLSFLLVIISILTVMMVAQFAMQYKGAEKYGDFLIFYAAADLFVNGDKTNLYDIDTQTKWQEKVLAEYSIKTDILAYFNPPFALIPLTPLTSLDPVGAYDSWILMNAFLLMVVAALVLTIFKDHSLLQKIIALIMALISVPVLFSFLLGQWGGLLFVIFLLAWRLYQADKRFAAGIVFSLILIKPHLAILPVLAFIAGGERKLLAGFIVASIFLLVLSLTMVGFLGVDDYITLLLSASGWSREYGNEIFAQHTLQTAAMIATGASIPDQVRILWAVAVSIIATVTIVAWRKNTSNQDKLINWSILILAIILVSPHTHFHDLTLISMASLILLYIHPRIKQSMHKKVVSFIITLSFVGYWVLVPLTTASGSISHEIFVLTSVSCMLAFYLTLLWLKPRLKAL